MLSDESLDDASNLAVARDDDYVLLTIYFGIRPKDVRGRSDDLLNVTRLYTL